MWIFPGLLVALGLVLAFASILLLAWFGNPRRCATPGGYRVRSWLIWGYSILVPTVAVFRIVADRSLMRAMPVDALWLLVPVSLTAFGFSSVLALNCFGRRAQRRRAQVVFAINPARCPICEYPLRAAAEPRCPECGWSADHTLPVLRASNLHVPVLISSFTMLSAGIAALPLRYSRRQWQSAYDLLSDALAVEWWFYALILLDLLLLLLLVTELVACLLPIVRACQVRRRGRVSADEDGSESQAM